MSRKVIAIFVIVLFVCLTVALFLPRHSIPKSISESGIPLKWDSREAWYLMSCKDQDRLQSILKNEGFTYAGSVDAADDGGLFGRNIWTKGRTEIEEGRNASHGDDCIVKSN